ncbi:MAG: hypothetical protein BWK73_28065 [Thiothrix lacustris]|uniref:Rap1a immunity protein domain-containing protein n=1 Tax=Thiothrix lacustris TaxID=525917 RepID=A0A1Y1QKA0_9GAMM|nr:MAG: hypothetical protein BWK73_28065 [Thiothrix lacustris]
MRLCTADKDDAKLACVLVTSAIHDSLSAGMIAGYSAGYRDGSMDNGIKDEDAALIAGMVLAEKNEAKNLLPDYCTKNTSLLDMIDAGVKYIKENPDTKEVNAGAVMYLAWKEAFPSTICRKTVSASIDGEVISKIDKEKREDAVKYVENLNKSLPIMLDSETRGDAITVDDDITFHYTLVNIRKGDQGIKLLEENARSQILKMVCTKNNKKWMDGGIDIVFSYKDKDGSSIKDFSFSKGDCL